jgi:hypothetical protein
MKYISFLLVLSLGSIGCTEKATAPLSPGKMQQVLYDIHLAEAYSTMARKDSTQRRHERDMDSLGIYYAAIFKHHQLSVDQFQESLQWYKQHPEQLDSVYSKMIPEMLKLEASQ